MWFEEEADDVGVCVGEEDGGYVADYFAGAGFWEVVG